MRRRLWLLVASATPGARALATSPPRLMVEGLRAVSDRYSVFLLDQYGVLHNGEALLPGVEEALEALAAAGKTLVVVSNTSKRRAALVAELPGRGFRPEWLAGAVCSGELCHSALGSGYRRALFLGWERDGDCSYLPSNVRPASSRDCDVVVAQGPDLLWDASPERTGFKETGDPTPYADAFERCIARDVPMLCANPDLVTIDPSGAALSMPGKLAAHYRLLGGRVVEFGKPHPTLFREALRIAGDPPLDEVLHVGDSLAHDVAGAAAAGVDSLFVIRSGVHADELSAENGGAYGAATATQIAALAAAMDAPVPTWACERFRL